MNITQDDIEKIKFITKDEALKEREKVNEAEKKALLIDAQAILTELEKEIKTRKGDTVSYTTARYEYTNNLSVLLTTILKQRGYTSYDVSGISMRSAGHNQLTITLQFI